MAIFQYESCTESESESSGNTEATMEVIIGANQNGTSPLNSFAAFRPTANPAPPKQVDKQALMKAKILDASR